MKVNSGGVLEKRDDGVGGWVAGEEVGGGEGEAGGGLQDEEPVCPLQLQVGHFYADVGAPW